MLRQLNDSFDIPRPVTVGSLIKALRNFDLDMPIILGAEGVFQGPPDNIYIQEIRSGEIAAVLWSD